jgi:hypothetical protein
VGFTVVPDKANGDVFTEAMWDTYIKDNFNTGVPVLLGSSTLGGTAASVSFSSISQSWNHLLVLGYARGDTAATFIDLIMRFNSDSGANYDRQYLVGSAAGASAGENFATTGVSPATVSAASAAANLFGGFSIWIPFYTSTANNKTAVCEWGHKFGTSSGNIVIGTSAFFWRSNSAITDVLLAPNTGSFVAGSRFSLYGMV